MSTNAANRRVALTVDVEALPIRATADHVNRLIWGRQQGREHGIGVMMDLADKHGVTMTFFLDYPEAELYGEDLLDVGREIRRRGHDLEPHCHAESLVPALFGSVGKTIRPPTASREQSLQIVDWWLERHARVCGSLPYAHRSGAYRIGSEYLDALRERGIPLDASYNPTCPVNPFNLGVRPQFRWTNGLWEIPIPLIPYFRRQGHLVSWNFNTHCFINGTQQENILVHKQWLDSWFKRHGDTAVPTLIMHSWSFWRMDGNGHFTIPADKNLETFDALLRMLTEHFDVIPLAQLAEEGAPEGLETVSPEDQTGHCPVCYEPIRHFQQYNSRIKRQCPFCHSVERHRTLVDLVYQGAFGPGVFQNKKILHIAPGWPESLLLRRMHGAQVTTLNILPGCDVQADIAHMPNMADNAFDIVLACEVFRHVRDLDAALAEICRVLRPGGLMLCSDCLERGDYGRVITDKIEQTAWYGPEKLAQYGIGDFRRFGRKDWQQTFTPWFSTRLFPATDTATGIPAWWLVCTPKKDNDDRRDDVLFSAAVLRSNAGRIFHDAAKDPVQDFLPGFHDWRHFHRPVPQDLTWLKEGIFTLHFRPLAAVPQETEDPPFPPSYPQDINPYSHQCFTHLLHEVYADPQHGDSPQLQRLVSEIMRWHKAYGNYARSIHMDQHTRRMIWYDAAVATRCSTMAYTLLRILPLPTYPAAVADIIFRAMVDHALLLCADHFFVERHNHGWIQMLGLLCFCRAFPQLRGAGAGATLAVERVIMLAKKLISPDGMLREHSPDYQAFVVVLFAKFGDFVPTGIPVAFFLERLLRDMLSRLTCFVKPNGMLAPFGDTEPRPYRLIQAVVREAALASESAPEITVLPQSGYAALRVHAADKPKEHPSYLAITGAFHSYLHKHCDDLGFVWSEGQQDLLVDSGMQQVYSGMLHSGPLWEKGFFYSAPNRVYAESAHAHNVVEINGETWSRRMPPYGALPLEGRQLEDGIWLLRGRWERPEGFVQDRTLVLRPRQWLLVQDTLTPCAGRTPEKTAFTQWFHFDAALELRKRTKDTVVMFLPGGILLHCRTFSSSSRITLHRGEIVPRLQGWQAVESNRTLFPAWAMGEHLQGGTALFQTVFSLEESCIGLSVRADVYALRFDNGRSCVFSLARQENT